MQFSNLLIIVAISATLFAHYVHAGRYFDRRTDLVTYPPISVYGWDVPLQGTKTCINATFCPSTLPPLPEGQTLGYVALARGFQNFTCAERKPNETPIFESRETTFWDAASLVPQIPDHSEQLFHTLIPQLYDFDYANLKNTSLVCIGGELTVGTATAFELFSIGILQSRPQRFIYPPSKPYRDMQWALFSSSDLAWNVYRVETVGGVPPTVCAGQQDHFQVTFAAEYWFYH